MAQLTIKNLGPIKECSLTINRITAFIGPQGSGKSTAAKLYTAFLWLEKSLTRSSVSRKECTTDFFISTVLKYIEIDHLVESDTELEYWGDNFHFTFSEGKLKIRQRMKYSQYVLPQILYMPAERSFLSVLNIFSIENLSPVLYELASSFSDAREQIAKNGFDLPINGFVYHYDKANNTSTITDKDSDYSVILNRAASGVQSVLPLALVFAYFLAKLEYKDKGTASILTVGQAKKIREIASKFSCDTKYKKNSVLTRILDKAGVEFVPDNLGEYDELLQEIRKYIDLKLTTVIEEPELNLFPEAQKELVEYLIKGINRNHGDILITTHSPYILESLNNLIYAGELANKGKDVSCIVPEDQQVRFDDVSAYLFGNGTAISILDQKLRDIDGVRLDSCSVLINKVYEKLEDVEYEAGK